MNKTVELQHLKTERFTGFSANQRIDHYTYKNVNIQEQEYIPHFWGKTPSTTVILDLQFPSGTYDCLQDGMYCDEGYGVPVFGTLEQAVEFINQIKVSQLN